MKTSEPCENVFWFRHESWLTNCYLISAGNGKAILIDAGAPVSFFASILDSNKLSLAAIFLTHSHRDHTENLDEWLSAFDIPVYSHSLSANRGHAVSDGDSIEVGSTTVLVLETPGHSNDHLCFVLDGKALFSGDLIFKSSVGGTISATGSLAQLRDSILNRILTLSDDIVIFPGHSDSTTVKEEKEQNPFIQYWSGQLQAAVERCSVRGHPATLLVKATDYDGGSKALVRFENESPFPEQEAIVPGSWIE